MWKYLLFIGIPLVELLILGLISERIGLGWTLLLVVVTGIIGARMVASQGRLVWRSFQTRLMSGEVPDRELAHGAMLIGAGAVLLTPGILTDIVGFLLLVPAIRELLRVRFLRTMRVIVR